MHLVKLSDTYGLNLDHIMEWCDFPEATSPSLTLWMSTTGAHADGQRHPHQIHVEGEERQLLLRWLDRVSQPSYHKAHE